MNQTAKTLYLWVKPKLGPLNARSYCRAKWKLYGEQIIKKALNSSACTSLDAFDNICKSSKNKKKLPPLWTPPS